MGFFGCLTGSSFHAIPLLRYRPLSSTRSDCIRKNSVLPHSKNEQRLGHGRGGLRSFGSWMRQLCRRADVSEIDHQNPVSAMMLPAYNPHDQPAREALPNSPSHCSPPCGGPARTGGEAVRSTSSVPGRQVANGGRIFDCAGTCRARVDRQGRRETGRNRLAFTSISAKQRARRWLRCSLRWAQPNSQSVVGAL